MGVMHNLITGLSDHFIEENINLFELLHKKYSLCTINCQ